jgi:glycosyltransferase involved in cell wall biosynthesis
LLGYQVFRAWFVWDALEEVIHSFKPDVVFAQSGLPIRIAAKCEELGIPVTIYLRNVEITDLGGDPSFLRGVNYIANSKFTAQFYRENFGIESTVVYPLIDRSRYVTPLRARNVTFINPHPHKGSDLALEIAEACPHIPFTFVKAWTLDSETERHLKNRIAKLKNVQLRQRTRVMRDIYCDARIVLAPSKWEEAFGRIAAEAHCSGIPVIAAKRGGLPEAVGPGGVVIESQAPVEVWKEAVCRLWHDETYWQELSKAAYNYGLREELNPNHQIELILSILSR